MSWDHTQLNIINNNTDTDIIDFKTFETFVEGTVRTGNYSDGVRRLGQPLLSLRYRGRIRQRQLQGAQQSDGDARVCAGITTVRFPKSTAG